MESKVCLCPCCDKAIQQDTKICPQCGQPVSVNSDNLATMDPLLINRYLKGFSKGLALDPDNQELQGYAAMCFLRLKLYDKAIPLFEKAIDCNFESADSYFMAAICLLRGKRPFLLQRADINKIIEYLNAANMIENKSIHHLLLTYIKQDYFERKYLKITPSSQEEMNMAESFDDFKSAQQTLNSLLDLE